MNSTPAMTVTPIQGYIAEILGYLAITSQKYRRYFAIDPFFNVVLVLNFSQIEPIETPEKGRELSSEQYWISWREGHIDVPDKRQKLDHIDRVVDSVTREVMSRS
jgi:hypothetical protein